MFLLFTIFPSIDPDNILDLPCFEIETKFIVDYLSILGTF